MKRLYIPLIYIAASFLAVCFFVVMPSTVSAASKDVSISSCSLSKSGKTVTVKATAHTKNAAYGEDLYLIALDAYRSEVKAVDIEPLAAEKNKKGTITFKVKYKTSMLYQKFAVACKSKGKYKIISNTYYITNPEVLASYTKNGPKTTSKKGLQAENTSDALNLRAQHVVLNWTINSILGDGYGATPYKYRGKTYYFNTDTIAYYDNQVQTFNAAGAKVTIILLLPNTPHTPTDSMRFAGSDTAHYSSINTSTQSGCRTFEALMTYLAEHYGTKKNLVSGWILGNEVNNQSEWNYGGGKSLSAYMSNYARALRICSNAVRSVSKNSNVYISLDYNWSLDADGGGNNFFSSKNTLNEFFKQLNKHGNIIFHIAYHAYPEALSDPVFWDDSHAINSVDSTFITFNNLNVLTDYVKTYFGKEYTIMLSEQSFNSTRGEAVQAAAYAYAYYKAESDGMIESFIYGRQYDHPIETNQGYYWGLHETTQKKRIIWDVFQYIDTSESFSFTDQLVKYTNLSSWNDIAGFKRSKYQKMPKINRKAVINKIDMKSNTSASISWNKVAFADGYEVYRNGKKIKTISTNEILSYTDKKLKIGTTYSYKVRAYKRVPSKTNANKRSNMYAAYSATKKITASPAQAVWAYDTQYNLAEGTQIKLKWIPQKGVSGYKILRSTSLDSGYKTIATSSKATYTDRNTKTGTAYFYKIRSYVTVKGKDYNGNASDPIGIESQIQVTGALSSGQLSLSWTNWPSAVKYRLYRSTLPDGEYKKVTETANTYWSHKDTPKLAFDVGETYYFKVCGILPDGSGTAYSNMISVVITEKLDSSKSTDAILNETEDAGIEPTESIPVENTQLPPANADSTEKETEVPTETPDSAEPEGSTESAGPDATDDSTGSTEPEVPAAPDGADSSTGSTEPDGADGSAGSTESGGTDGASPEESGTADGTESGNTFT